MHAMLKTGGHFISSYRAIYNEPGEEHGYKDKLDELIAAGKFELLKTWTYKRGVPGDEINPRWTEVDSFMFLVKRID